MKYALAFLIAAQAFASAPELESAPARMVVFRSAHLTAVKAAMPSNRDEVEECKAESREPDALARCLEDLGWYVNRKR